MELYYINLLIIYFNFILFSIDQCIHSASKHVKLCILLQTIAVYGTFISRYNSSFFAVTPSNVKSTFYRSNILAPSIYRGQIRILLKSVICFVSQMMCNVRLNTLVVKSRSVVLQMCTRPEKVI